MTDIKVLMVCDGSRFNFGPKQPLNSLENDDIFAITALRGALTGSTTPLIQLDRAHRRGATTGATPDVSQNLTYPGDFVFTDAILNAYDVVWLLCDEGSNFGADEGSDLLPAENIALANFMARGGGLFAVGDHDGVGSHMGGKIPRARLMRHWFEYGDTNLTDAISGQTLTPNWSGGGTATSAPSPDRNDTLQPDSVDTMHWYFYDQGDPTPQALTTIDGAPLDGSAFPIHAILRDRVGLTIGKFPDHMHEGEATDLTTVSPTAFNPNDGSGNPWQCKFDNGMGGTTDFPEFKKDPDGALQPKPEVIAWGVDTGHETIQQTITYGKTGYKVAGKVAVYDGRAVGLGRIVTGSTFHHYLDKNVLGDPGTTGFETTGNNVAPTNSDLGLPADVQQQMGDYYLNVVTWLARPNPSFHFLTTKNTFGLDETQNTPGGFINAFFLALEGFAPGAIGTPTVALSGAFHAAATITPGTMMYSGPPGTVQRILFPFTVNAIAPAQFPGALPAKVLSMGANITINGEDFFAESLFELTPGADPYFTNVDPANPQEFYLSQDLRVFQVTPGLNPIPFGLTFSDASSYVTGLLTHLNSSTFDHQGATDPFTTLQEGNDLIEDSSVNLWKLNAQMVPFQNYNFAVARVRLRGAAGTPASNVRVFFRLFETQSNDTDFDPLVTYRSTYDTNNQPNAPLPGLDGTTTPMFAISVGSDYPGANQRNMQVQTTGQETYAYFGCYLDVFNNPAVSLTGTHHCLVAQIACDDSPIEGASGITLSPENTDKLAQRNMQITTSGNPGGPDAHRVPQTFECRPSLRQDVAANTLLGYPDELMIDWGEVPVGSKAMIYWPQAKAIDVVRLAMLLYAGDEWRVVDEHTVACTVRSRISFVPIPFGSGAKLAGLFTIDLPIGVRAGQRFQIVVRRIATRRPPPIVGVKVDNASVLNKRASTRRVAAAKNAAPRTTAQHGRAKSEPVRDWRYVVGTFQVAIPVAREDDLLWAEENTLAIMKWRLERTPAANRWHPVLARYVSYLSIRVDAFGGHAGSVVASPLGAPPPKFGHPAPGHPHPGHPTPGHPGDADLIEFTGKVSEVIYDCFGDFKGFELDTCHGSHVFVSCEPGIGERVLRACQDRLRLSVFVNRMGEHKVRKLVVRA